VVFDARSLPVMMIAVVTCQLYSHCGSVHVRAVIQDGRGRGTAPAKLVVTTVWRCAVWKCSAFMSLWGFPSSVICRDTRHFALYQRQTHVYPGSGVVGATLTHLIDIACPIWCFSAYCITPPSLCESLLQCSPSLPFSHHHRRLAAVHPVHPRPSLTFSRHIISTTISRCPS
jgi:hypothetical protein